MVGLEMDPSGQDEDESWGTCQNALLMLHRSDRSAGGRIKLYMLLRTTNVEAPVASSSFTVLHRFGL